MRFTGGDAEELVQGRGKYLADLDLDALEVAFVRSPFPAARIGAIDFGTEAGKVPAGATAADLDLPPIRVEGPGLTADGWPPLARDRVRFVGEAVAAVWGETRHRAEDLADAVTVDYEPTAGVAVHDAAPDGVLFRLAGGSGDLDAARLAAPRRIRRTFTTGRQTPLPLETRGVAASFEDGRLTVWTSTQVPHLAQSLIVACLGLPSGKVRVIVPRVGGGFGLKAHVFPEEIVVAALAIRLGRPVRWVEDRRENLMASAHAHEERVMLDAAFTADGRVLGVEATVVADVGAYSIFPFAAGLEAITTAQTIFGPYAIEAYRFQASGVASNRCPAGAYRGVGMNAGVHATERLLDIIATELGIDPLEVRRRNAVRSFPHLTPAGRDLDSGDYQGLLARLAAAAGYDALRAEQVTARAEGRLVGIGICLFNEHSGTGVTEYRERGINSIPGTDSARVRILEDGTVEVHTSGAEAGQGHPETLRLLAARELGVAPDSVVVVEGDTDSCPPGSGTFVSRGAVGGLSSVARALRQAAEQDLKPGLDVTVTVDPRQVFPSGAHLAVVEIDPLSLVPKVVRYVAVEDCGVVVNRAAVDGQVRGGVATGLGGALLEEIAYSAEEQIQTVTLLDYLVPLASDVPDLELHHLQSPSPHTALGSKGVGEGGTIGAFGAVPNAVADALAPLGVETLSLPLSPNAIYSALAATQQIVE